MIDCPLSFAAVHFRGKVHAMLIHLLDGKKKLLVALSSWKCYLQITDEARDELTEDESRGD